MSAFDCRRAYCSFNNMIKVIIHLKVSAEKRKELFRTVPGGFINAQLHQGSEGLRALCFFYSTQDENILCLLEEWDTQKNLDAYYATESFKILRGVMNLLEEPREILTYQCFQPAEIIEGRC